MAEKELPKGITRRSDGRYMGRFMYAGERYTLYDTNVKRLKKAMEDKRYELEHGLYGKGDKIRLDKWFEEVIEVYKKPVLKESTLVHYQVYYRLYIKEALGNKYIKDIKSMHIQKLYNNMKAKGYKTNTVKKVANIIRIILEQAVMCNLIMKNPCLAVTLPRADTKKKEILTEEEQKRFLEFVQNSKQWRQYYPLFLVGFGTGMRIGEILALNWGDIDFINGVIRVNKTLQYLQSEVDKKCRYVIQTPKTSSSIRTIPMVSQLVEILKKHWEEQHTQIIYLGDAWQKNGEKLLRNLVFTTRFGNPMDRNSVNRSISSIIRDLNKEGEEKAKKENSQYVPIKDFSPHCMRHSFATRCFEAGIEPKIIQMYMGHSTLAVTMDIYTHVSENGKKEEIKKIEKAV